MAFQDATHLPIPDLFGFRELLDRGPSLNPSTPDRDGLLKGSSLLVTGRPGTGKSFFTLSLMWEHLLAVANPPDDAYKSDEGCELIYVGLQLDESAVEAMFAQNGWHRTCRTNYSVVTVRETDLPQPVHGAEEVVNRITTKLRETLLLPRFRSKAVFVVFDTISGIVKASRSTGERQRLINEILSVTRQLLGLRKAFCAMVADTPNDPDDIATQEKEIAADYVMHLEFLESGGGQVMRTLDVRKSSQAAPLLLGCHSWAIVTSQNARSVFAFSNIVSERKRRRRNSKNRWAEAAFFPHHRQYDIGSIQDPRWTTKDNVRTIAIDSKLSCGVPGLDQMLNVDIQYWSRPTLRILKELYPDPACPLAGNWEPNQKGLIQGSVTFLVGKAGTGKTNCCLQFLLAHDDLARCLYVNFENRPHRISECYPGSDQQHGRLSKIARLFRRRSHLDVNLLLNEIRWIVNTNKIERIAIDGLSDLAQSHSPEDFNRLVEELVHTIRISNVHLRLSEGTAPRSQLAGQKADGRQTQIVTIMITLEADPDDRNARAMELTDSPADNVVILRQITLNDERRETVEVRKSRGQSPDKQVREMVIRPREHYPMRVVPGLDNYRGLRSAVPAPVSIALQLIQENAAQGACNARLLDRLRVLFAYEVRPFGFSRGEIVGTLLDIAGGTDRIPFSDVKLFHIDEWWVRELRVKALREPGEVLAQTRHPLLRLNQFLAGERREGLCSRKPYSPMPTDFWALEMEKVCTPVVPGTRGYSGPKEERKLVEQPFQADVVALPSYTDYGIFCANKTVLKTLKHFRPKSSQWDWQILLNQVPRAWARSQLLGDVPWFAAPNSDSADTLVDTVGALANDEDFIGFAFDMATPTTTACMFLELCWAFGAPEEVFVSDVAKYGSLQAEEKAKFVENHAATRALAFLMYLVAEGLMPPRTTLADARRAAFSRLWYSNIPVVDEQAIPAQQLENFAVLAASAGEGARAIPLGLKAETAQQHQQRTDSMFLVLLPFFPLGTVGVPSPEQPDAEFWSAIRIFLVDSVSRFVRWLDRLEAVVHYRTELIVNGEDAARTVQDAISSARASVSQVNTVGDLTREVVQAAVASLREAGQAIRTVAISSPFFAHGRGYEREYNRGKHAPNLPGGFDPKYPGEPERPTPDWWVHLPYAMFMDVRDALELLALHDFRLKCLEAAVSETPRPLGDLICSSPKEAPATSSTRLEAVSGFCCEGAWAIGVDRNTRSPNLASKVLMELASLGNATDRALAGAGIPARKDFYELHGHNFVPLAPQHPEMTWQKFIRHVGSRARRRTRAFCSRVELSAAFAEIDRMVFAALGIADQRRDEYRTIRTPTAQTLVGLANSLVQELFDWVTAAMKQGYEGDAAQYASQPESPTLERAECVTCNCSARCQKFLRPLTENPTPGPANSRAEGQS